MRHRPPEAVELGFSVVPGLLLPNQLAPVYDDDVAVRVVPVLRVVLVIVLMLVIVLLVAATAPDDRLDRQQRLLPELPDDLANVPLDGFDGEAVRAGDLRGEIVRSPRAVAEPEYECRRQVEMVDIAEAAWLGIADDELVAKVLDNEVVPDLGHQPRHGAPLALVMIPPLIAVLQR
jgi:hypothetical protein